MVPRLPWHTSLEVDFVAGDTRSFLDHLAVVDGHGGDDVERVEGVLASVAVAVLSWLAQVQASGNVTLFTVRSVARTGVDAISVGGITHSAAAFDLSLLLTPTTLAGESPRAAADGRPAQRFE
ncbi:hypothetical protein ABZ442_31115 [Streptomyces triculaminicus]|uniref:hypothetical protein n=1 Tax=Streptomyces triculaminicus TaxID=2816232 RepID=UPI00340C47A7